MKRKIVLAALCFALALAGCTKSSFIEENKKSAAANDVDILISTDGEDITSDAMTTDGLTVSAHETFAEIPAKAERSFDRVIKSIDKNFPKADSDKRFYGYLGEQQIDGTECYVFEVFDSSDGERELVMVAAITFDNSRVYVLNEETSQFWLLEQYSDKVKVDYSWTMTKDPDEVTTDEE